MTGTSSRRAAELRSTAAKLLRLASEIEADEGVLKIDCPARVSEGISVWSDLNTQIIVSKAMETYKSRRRRAKFFSQDIFGEPSWDILLDLFTARLQNRRISVMSACYASGVPSTTALRWLGVLEEAGLIERVENNLDSRSTLVRLSDSACKSMYDYFEDFLEGSNRIERDITEYLILDRSESQDDRH